MCEISSGFKLCTCHGHVNKSENYWEFHRFKKGKNMVVIGTPSWAAIIDPEKNSMYKVMLLEALNSGNPFDVDLQPKKKDRLALFFRTEGNLMGSHLEYGFEFDGKRWLEKSYDGLGWMWHHEEKMEGEINYPAKPQKLPVTA